MRHPIHYYIPDGHGTAGAVISELFGLSTVFMSLETANNLIGALEHRLDVAAMANPEVMG